MSQTTGSSKARSLKLTISNMILACSGPVRKLDHAQGKRLGIGRAGRYGAARLPSRGNSRRRQAPQRT
jgi:hypothetical protein